MKNIMNLYKLRMMLVLKSSILIVPTIAVLAFLEIMYSFPPVEVSGSFLISGLFLFVLCAYIAMSIQIKENDVQEEIFLLHSKSELGYYMSREMILVTISLFYAIVIIVFPIIKLVMRPNLFSRPLESRDIIFGGLLIIGSGFLGVSLGDIFHHRIFVRKREMLTGLIFVSVVAACKIPIIEKFSFLWFINIICPPIVDGLEMVADTDVFSPTGTLLIFLHMIIYVAVVMFVKIKLLMNRKY